MISIKLDFSGKHFMNLSLLCTVIGFNKRPRILRFLLFVFVFFIPMKLMATERTKSNTSEHLDSLKHKEFLPSEQIEGFTVTRITKDLKSPWGMDFLPDGRMLVTEKDGHLVIVDLKTGLKTMVEMVKPNIAVKGQGGLLDVAIGPDFDKEGWVYLSYAAGDYSPETKGLFGTEVGRGRLAGNRLTEFETLFVAMPKTDRRTHFGSRLIFDDKKYLYITLGDRGKRYESQKLSSHLGSVIRLHRDGSIPNDNPFLKQKDALNEIYSYGHRNIQGAIFDSLNNRIWLTEHGPQGGDELNILKPGVNYGWPKITYGKEYGSGRDIGEGVDDASVEAPVWQWTPSIAPSGLAIYRGALFPEWDGQLLAGALKFKLMSRLSYDGKKAIEKQRLFEDEFGRIRDISVDSSGAIYLLTNSGSSELIKIVPGKKSNR